MTIPNTTKTGGPVVLLFLLALGGCFSLGRKTPILEQYVLGSAPTTEVKAASRDPAGLTIGLRRLDLAPYLATPAIVVRRGDHQIVTSEFHRWGEDLAEGINRSVARHVGAETRVRTVDIAPWPAGSRYDYLIQLHVLHLEGLAPEEPSATGGEARVAATWEIIRQDDGTVLARGATDHREHNWKVGDYAGLVTLLDRGLNTIAHDLGICLGSLGPVALRTSGSVEAKPAVGPALACFQRSE